MHSDENKANATPSAGAATNGRALEQEILLQVNQAVIETLDLDKVLQIIAEGTARLMDVETTAIYLIEGQEMTLGATTPPLPPGPPNDLLRAQLSDHPHVSEAVSTRLTVVLPDTEQVVLSPAEKAIVDQRSLRSLIYMPFQHKDQVVGILILGTSSSARVFSKNEITLCRNLCNALALGIQNTRLHAELKQQADDLETQIGKRKKLEATLHRSEEKYRNLFEQSPEEIFILGLDGTIIDCNISDISLVGLRRDEMIGKHFAEIDLLGPEAKDQAKSFFTHFVEGQSSVSEWEIKTRTGDQVWLEMHPALVNDAGEQTIRVLVNDITQRKQAQEKQAALEAKLHHSQKMEAVGRLAGGVAHDFNNVLSAIRGNAELALENLPAGDPLGDSLEAICYAADRASHLTRQLLSFSSRQVIEPKVLDLSRMVEQIHPMLVRLIGEDVIFRTNLHENAGHVRADPAQIEQIVLNLVINARDAMPEGGELVIESAPIYLDDTYCESHVNVTPGQYVMLEVSDTGQGMSAEIRHRAFEPFFTTKPEGKGTGLGLSTVFGILEQCGGNIEIYSEPGQGTSIKMYFPNEANDATSTASSDAAPRQTGQETVLVVEDEAMVRTVAVKLLQHLGYQLLTADSGAEALKLAKGHAGPIHILLTDVVMPKMNGRVLAEHIDKLRPGIKVLFTSGYNQNLIASRGVIAEGVEYLAKPYSLDTIAARIREVLDAD